MRCVLLLALLAPSQDAVKLAYGTETSPKDKVYSESKLEIKIEGSDQMVNFVRSMHPFLSIEKMLIRADGTRQLPARKKHRVEYDEARIELRYDDDDHEFDFKKGSPPENAQKDKLTGMMWMFMVGGRNYTLSAEGEYRSEDSSQDHNGEAMDIISLGITRMPDTAVKAGETYVREWTGARAEKKKDAKFKFQQKVTVEKIEEKDGKKIATLTSNVTGQLEGPGARDPGAEEGWTKCEGKTKLLLEVATGRILASEGMGKVIAYYKGTAEDGSKNELRLTFSVSGKLSVK